MGRRKSALLLAAVLVLAGRAPAGAATISDGEVIASGIDDFGFTTGANTLSFDGGAHDELFEMVGYLALRNPGTGGVVRVIDSGQGRGFSVTEGVDAGTIGTSVVDLTAAGAARLDPAAALGLAANDIRIRYSYSVFDDTSLADNDVFRWVVDITNNSSSSVDLSFYAYMDLDLQGSSGGDSAALLPGGEGMLVTDANGSEFVWNPLGTFSHYQVGPYSGAGSIRDVFRGMVQTNVAQDLDDTGLPFGPADFTGAFQFDVTLAPGATATLGPAVVPEPRTAVLILGGLAGLAVWGRPRRVVSRPA